MASDIGQKIFDLEKHSADFLKNVSGATSALEPKIQESHGIFYYNEKMPHTNYLKTCDAFENDACCSKIKELSKKCGWPARTYENDEGPILEVAYRRGGKKGKTGEIIVAARQPELIRKFLEYAPKQSIQEKYLEDFIKKSSPVSICTLRKIFPQEFLEEGLRNLADLSKIYFIGKLAIHEDVIPSDFLPAAGNEAQHIKKKVSCLASLADLEGFCLGLFDVADRVGEIL